MCHVTTQKLATTVDDRRDGRNVAGVERLKWLVGNDQMGLRSGAVQSATEYRHSRAWIERSTRSAGSRLRLESATRRRRSVLTRASRDLRVTQMPATPSPPSRHLSPARRIDRRQRDRPSSPRGKQPQVRFEILQRAPRSLPCDTRAARDRAARRAPTDRPPAADRRSRAPAETIACARRAASSSPACARRCAGAWRWRASRDRAASSPTCCRSRWRQSHFRSSAPAWNGSTIRKHRRCPPSPASAGTRTRKWPGKLTPSRRSPARRPSRDRRRRG